MLKKKKTEQKKGQVSNRKKWQLCGENHPNYKHGKSKTRIYSVWRGMVNRCFNKKNTRYKHYGGRGITIYDEWLDFRVFYNWAMANGYKKGLSIERKDNDGDYCPENCTFIPLPQQSRNRRYVIKADVNGSEMCLAETARQTGIHRTTLKNRIDAGWKKEDVFSKGMNLKYNKKTGDVKTIIVTYKGKTQTLRQWADELGVKYCTLWKRVRHYNMDPITALKKPNWRERGRPGF